MTPKNSEVDRPENVPSSDRTGADSGSEAAQPIGNRVNAPHTHRALDLRPPEPEHRTLPTSPARSGDVIRRDRLGGLIHEYNLAA
jgi:hypothetical protein